MFDSKDPHSHTALLCIYSRSGDIGVINRTFTGDAHDFAAGCHGTKSVPSIEQVRYDFPKTWKTMVRMSEWKPLGQYLSAHPAYRSEYSLCCVRAAVETYYSRTANFDIEPQFDDRRPLEPVFRLFVSLHKKSGKYFSLRPSSVAPLVKEELRLSGIDVSKFQSHNLRSASMKTAIDAGLPQDVVLRVASVSQKVFAVHYDLPLDSATSAVSSDGMLGSAAVECLMGVAAPSSSAAVAVGNRENSAAVATYSADAPILALENV
jgi:hypothetical protein